MTPHVIGAELLSNRPGTHFDTREDNSPITFTPLPETAVKMAIARWKPASLTTFGAWKKLWDCWLDFVLAVFRTAAKFTFARPHSHERQHEHYYFFGGFVLDSFVVCMALVTVKISLARVGEGKRV